MKHAEKQEAFSHADQLSEIQYAAQKALTVLSIVADGYFGRLKYKKDWCAMAQDFDKNGLLCEIAEDYLFSILSTVTPSTKEDHLF